jgi:hypothetical protein
MKNKTLQCNSNGEAIFNILAKVSCTTHYSIFQISNGDDKLYYFVLDTMDLFSGKCNYMCYIYIFSYFNVCL